MTESKTYIYAIQHNITKKIYVGSTNNPSRRYYDHITKLKAKRHSSSSLQNDFDEYGEDFSFFILEDFDSEKEDEVIASVYGCLFARKEIREYEWMRKLGTIDPRIGYNDNDKQAIIYIKKSLDPDVPFVEGVPTPIKID